MSISTPKGLKWTYEDYAQLPDDGRRHEIIGGEHFVNPSPSMQSDQQTPCIHLGSEDKPSVLAMQAAVQKLAAATTSHPACSED